MELKQLIEDLNQALYEEMIEDEKESYTAKVGTPHGSVEAWYHCTNGTWELEVYVYHDDTDNDHETPNLETYLAQEMEVDWAAVEEYWRDADMDEYQRNGFASEADFWRWKEGR